MQRPLALLALGVLCFATVAPMPAAAAHPHYERLLRRGTYALEREAYPEAARDLRLACFGVLEEPPVLAACLTRLGVAQAAIGDDEGFLETYRRVAEVEERFGAYSEAGVTPETRSRFEALVLALVPVPTLEASPTFAPLLAAETDEAPTGEAVPREPAKPLEPPAEPRTAPEPVPPPPPELPEPALEAPAERQAEAVPEPTPAPPPATEPTRPEPRPELNPEDRETLERAYALLGRARTREELEEPYRLAREVADANPAARGAQHLAAVIAYRSARWDEAVRYFRRGGDPGDDDPETLFYLAVSLYEAGEPEAAAETLRRSLPRIERTPFVRSYEAKILGNGGDTPGPGTGS